MSYRQRLNNSLRYIVTKNNVDTIVDCVDSVLLNQTYRDFKLIVCDLNSTDGTYQKLTEKYHDNQFVTIRKEDFRTKAEAYNLCVNKRQGCI